MRTVKLYLNYCGKTAPVLRELGYPSRKNLNQGQHLPSQGRATQALRCLGTRHTDLYANETVASPGDDQLRRALGLRHRLFGRDEAPHGPSN
jgi:hypothetical protein